MKYIYHVLSENAFIMVASAAMFKTAAALVKYYNEVIADGQSINHIFLLGGSVSMCRYKKMIKIFDNDKIGCKYCHVIKRIN